MKKNEKEFNFEEGVNILESIVTQLENPDTGLDESIKIYKQGIEILKKCSDKLNDAEMQVIDLTKNPV